MGPFRGCSARVVLTMNRQQRLLSDRIFDSVLQGFQLPQGWKPEEAGELYFAHGLERLASITASLVSSSERERKRGRAKLQKALIKYTDGRK